QLLLVDEQLADLGRALVERIDTKVRIVVAGGADDEYEDWVASAAPVTRPVTDEWSLLSLNYTSGTTGRPKGVMYAHRGAYLQALAMLAHTQMSPASSYLWTLPMFHCNGWSFPWAVTAATARHVCLHKVDAADGWRLIDEDEV